MSNTQYHVKCKGDGKEPHAREGVEGQQLRGHDDAARDDEGKAAEGEQEEEGEFQQLWIFVYVLQLKKINLSFQDELIREMAMEKKMKNSQNQYIKLTFQNSLINDFLRVNALLSLLFLMALLAIVPSRQPPWKQLSSSIAGECCQVVEMSSMLLSTMSLFSQAKHFSVSASLLIRLHLKENRTAA